MTFTFKYHIRRNGRAVNRYGRNKEMHTRLQSEYMKRRDYLRNLDVDGRMHLSKVYEGVGVE